MLMFLGQADLVKSAMAGFTLPSLNIPDWAKRISDDQLKQSIVDSLQNKKKNEQEN